MAAIYPELAPTLRVAAALSLTAHLLKLEDEGRVARTPGHDGDDLWHLAGHGSWRAARRVLSRQRSWL